MPVSQSRQANKRLHRACVEVLEKRTFLNAVINGVFTDTGTNVLEYKQADGSSVRISIFGNVTAEFIFARVPDASFTTILRDAVPAGSADDGVDLFSIYIVQSDINSAIAIAQVPDPNTTGGRPMQPFSGSAGTLTIFEAQRAELVQVDLGAGQVFLGARTHDFQGANTEDLNDRPIINPSDGRRRFGLRPSSAGEMFAGLEVAAGNDLGKFMVGGAITGLVDIPGNVRLFYAGSIVTGDALGLGDESISTVPNNFFVGGDLEQLVCGTSLGTSPGLDQAELEDINYKTGFQLKVNGRIGWIKVLDSFLGTIQVNNLESVTGLGLAQEELEFSGDDLPANDDSSYFDPQFFGDSASLGTKSPNAAYDNGSFDSAQYLGTLFSQDLNSREAIQLRGYTFTTEGDSIDYYAVALMAGQTVQVQLLDSLSAIGIFDPDNRLIATDYSNVNSINRFNKPFRFTADRPGAYRIAVANRGDINFNGVADGEEDISSISPDFYELRIQRVADIALGGLVTGSHIATMDRFDFGGRGIDVARGDLGAVVAGTPGSGGTIFSKSSPWTIAQGNLRSVEADSMGILRNAPVLTVVGLGPDFLVPKGSIGLLRTNSSDTGNSVMFVNQRLVSINDDLSLIDPALAVGADIQLVDAGANLQSNLLANRAIGVIRGGNVSALLGSEPGVWAVNVDQIGDDGKIDLIDIDGDLGELGPGGPAIATGPGGNVRHMRVSGLTFRDRFFGGGSPEETTFQPGETVRLTDDNGTSVALTPIPLIRNSNVNGLPVPGFNNPGFLRVQTYPIRDKAGVVIMRIVANPGASGAGRGVQVSSGSRGSGGSVEIGEIVVRSPGTDQVFDPFTRTFSPQTGAQNSDVLIGGSSPVDVWSIECRDPGSDDFNGLTQIVNTTSGEIVNVQADHIGLIEAETVGLARQSTGAAVNGVNVLFNNAYPFLFQRNLVAATGSPGHIGTIRARRGIGNVFAQGTIGTVVANSDRKNVKGVFEGISGPLLAVHSGGTALDTGNIITVNVGEGLASSGSGQVAFAGIFADGQIDTVRNGGLGSDIHGDIVSRGDTPPQATRTVNGVVQTTPEFFIGDIILTDGAIIDADIMTITDEDSFLDSRETDNEIVIPERGNVLTAPTFEIRSIRINGLGGLLGANVTADDIGPIVINGGFGVIGSVIGSLGDSVIDGVQTDGYGVRTTDIRGGAVLNRVIARGTGKRINTTFYTSSVRNSERMSFDPYSGNFLDASNDLHKYLGTTAANPKRIGLSDAGVIEDCRFTGSRSLGQIDAHRIIGRNVFFTDPITGRRARLPFGSVAYPMRISFGNLVNTIRTRDVVDGLALISGGLNLFAPGNDVHNTAINVSGRIRNITAGGALRGTTSIKALGAEARIDNITTKRSLYAQVESSLDIGTIKVGTDLGSPRIRTGRHLEMLNVTGSTLTDSLVSVNRRLGSLIIGFDHQDGATIMADEIGSQQIGGQVLGDIIIT